jgi:hypothetical protein
MEFHNDHLQENKKYAAPEKFKGLDHLPLTSTVIEGYRERTSLK